MRDQARTVIGLGLALGLMALFLRNADFASVWSEIRGARFDLVCGSLLAIALSYAFRVRRWQQLLAPIGQVGFLTEAEFSDTLEADLERLKTGDYDIEKLQRLDVRLNDLSVGLALNEAVIHTAGVAKIQKFRIKIDGQIADEFRADGVIVATPTGSTSYAMSAGSPILHPTVGAHVIVPIAPYRIGSRPLVIPDNMELGIRLLNPQQSVIVLDGHKELAVGEDDKITIVKSTTPARFVRFGNRFFERVQRKLQMR